MGLVVPLVAVQAVVILVLNLAGRLSAETALGAFAVLAVASAALAWPVARNVEMLGRWSGRSAGQGVAAPPRLQPGPLSASLRLTLDCVHRALAERDRRIGGQARETEHLLDALPDPLVLLSRESQVVFLNSAARLLFGDVAAGQHLSRVLRDPGFDSAVERVLEGGAAATGIEIVVTRDRLDRFYAVDVVPLAGTAGERAALLAICHDMTGARRTEQMRVDFVANASHEIRSPLATLIGCIETLLGPARDDAGDREMFLAMMDEQGKRMARLVEDLLSLSRIELREHTQPAGEVSVPPLLRRLRSSLKFDADERSMTIECAVPETLSPVRGDEGEVEQALYNLLSNAIKYARAGTAVTLTAGEEERTPDHLLAARGPLVWVAVADTGDGIESHHLPRLTERFYRVDTARSRELGGTGLGLAIVKHILSRHRGELHVESTPGTGSVFTVWLPAAAHPQDGGAVT